MINYVLYCILLTCTKKGKPTKQELFYEKESIYIDRIIDFEHKLEENINNILDALHFEDDQFFNKLENIGNFKFIFKNIELKNNIDNFSTKYTIDNHSRKLFDINNLSYRYMADISIVFQIIGGIWMNRIGYQIDGNLPENLYGCRMKPYNVKLREIPYYKQNHSFYKPYFNDYKKWQNDLFNVISNNPNKDIQVITADITKYYHSININTLKDKVDKIIEINKIEMNDSEKFIHELLFTMIETSNQEYNKNYSFYRENNLNQQEFGLPLTLNVSRILSNIYLLDFDNDLIDNVKPLYYGRYVDDLIIALNYKEDNNTLDKILKDLNSHSLQDFSTKDSDSDKHNYVLTSTENSANFRLLFNQDKLRMFLLNGIKDNVEINHLIKSINHTSSEWKLLPTNDDYDDIDKIDLFYKLNDECESVNSIRKSSNLILKRNKFIREIINFESYIYNHTDFTWKKRLNNFLAITYNYIFDFKNFVDLNKFVPRLFGLLIHTSNEDLIEKYFDQLEKVLNVFAEKPHKELEIAKKALYEKIGESIIYSSNLKGFENKTILRFMRMNYNLFNSKILNYFNCDFHIEPFKSTFFKYEEYHKYLIKWYNPFFIFSEELKQVFSLNDDVISFIKSNLESICNSSINGDCNDVFYSTGFYFFTRRASILELSVAFKNSIITDKDNFIRLSNYYYHRIESDLIKNRINDQSNSSKGKPQYIDVIFKEEGNSNNPIICNTHLLTKDDSFDARVRNYREPDTTRVDRILNLINNIINYKTKIDYLVFHELSLPRNLYLFIAAKLAFNKINLIAGLEYKIDRKNNNCDNQLVYVLNIDNNFTGSIALYQSKIIGAVGETQEIYRKSGLKIQPRYEDKLVINHQNFIFTGLICNDMLDINNRSDLRGDIDCLFVVAWNKDLETYYHMVKSASLDLHCFISLNNNRKYGDTRIRAPYKMEFQRDIQRIYGGDLDNFMISKIDVSALRDYHYNITAPDMPFKPLPTGFEISEIRKKK